MPTLASASSLAPIAPHAEGFPTSDGFVYNGHLAVDCLPYDTTDPSMDEVKALVTEQHLLQFGMTIGESSAELAIGMQGAAQPVGETAESLFGRVDCPEQYARGWEPIVEAHSEGLHYWVHRRHLRKGLFTYKSRTGGWGGRQAAASSSGSLMKQEQQQQR